MKKILLTLASVLLFALCVEAQDAKYKALFIYNFTKQINWPSADKNGDFVICVVNHNELASQLTTITTGKKLGMQDIVVKKVKTVDEISKCHILFLGTGVSNAANMEKATGIVADASTLIVTERTGSLEKGSAINFYVQDEKIKIEIRKDNVTAHKLQMASDLDKFAR